MKPKIDKAALAEAVRKTAKLRVEDVGGRKERPAETVQSCLNRGFSTLGSPEGISYILRHAVGYYLEDLTTAGYTILGPDEIHAPSVDLDAIATALWREEAVDSGTPRSVAEGRTRQAFDNQSDELKARWRKFARAALRELMKEMG